MRNKTIWSIPLLAAGLSLAAVGIGCGGRHVTYVTAPAPSPPAQVIVTSPPPAVVTAPPAMTIVAPSGVRQTGYYDDDGDWHMTGWYDAYGYWHAR